MTSANGTIIVTNPIGNSAAAADVSTDALAIEKADLILLAGAEDDASLRNTVNLAQKTHARIVAPQALVTWFKSHDADFGPNQLVASAPGNRLGINGVTIRTLRASAPPATWVVPASVGYLITFETGQTLYFAGDTTALDDQATWGQTYQPTVAILDMNADTDPSNIALQVQLLQTGNPNLTTIVPHHYAISPPADATAPAYAAQREMDNLGLALTVSTLLPGQSLDSSVFSR